MLRASSGTKAVIRCETWLVEDQHSKAKAGVHILDGDEPQDRGGTNRGPAPLEYLLASLGLCQQTMIARNLVLLNLSVESVRIELKGYFDRRGGHIENITPRGVEEIRLKVLFESPEVAETIRRVMDAVELQCYVFNTLRRAVAISTEVFLNGERILQHEDEPG
jgi:putative redox protein